MALPEEFPRERASAFSDNVSKHGVVFIERGFCAVREGVPNLDSPEGVGVRG